MGLSSPRSMLRAMAAEPAEDPGPDPCVPASRRPAPAYPAQHASFASAPKTLATCLDQAPAHPAHVRSRPAMCVRASSAAWSHSTLSITSPGSDSWPIAYGARGDQGIEEVCECLELGRAGCSALGRHS